MGSPEQVPHVSPELGTRIDALAPERERSPFQVQQLWDIWVEYRNLDGPSQDPSSVSERKRRFYARCIEGALCESLRAERCTDESAFFRRLDECRAQEFAKQTCPELADWDHLPRATCTTIAGILRRWWNKSCIAAEPSLDQLDAAKQTTLTALLRLAKRLGSGDQSKRLTTLSVQTAAHLINTYRLVPTPPTPADTDSFVNALFALHSIDDVRTLPVLSAKSVLDKEHASKMRTIHQRLREIQHDIPDLDCDLLFVAFIGAYYERKDHAEALRGRLDDLKKRSSRRDWVEAVLEEGPHEPFLNNVLFDEPQQGQQQQLAEAPRNLPDPQAPIRRSPPSKTRSPAAPKPSSMKAMKEALKKAEEKVASMREKLEAETSARLKAEEAEKKALEVVASLELLLERSEAQLRRYEQDALQGVGPLTPNSAGDSRLSPSEGDMHPTVGAVRIVSSILPVRIETHRRHVLMHLLSKAVTAQRTRLPDSASIAVLQQGWPSEVAQLYRDKRHRSPSPGDIERALRHCISYGALLGLTFPLRIDKETAKVQSFASNRCEACLLLDHAQMLRHVRMHFAAAEANSLPALDSYWMQPEPLDAARDAEEAFAAYCLSPISLFPELIEEMTEVSVSYRHDHPEEDPEEVRFYPYARFPHECISEQMARVLVWGCMTASEAAKKWEKLRRHDPDASLLKALKSFVRRSRTDLRTNLQHMADKYDEETPKRAAADNLTGSILRVLSLLEGSNVVRLKREVRLLLCDRVFTQDAMPLSILLGACVAFTLCMKLSPGECDSVSTQKCFSNF